MPIVLDGTPEDEDTLSRLWVDMNANGAYDEDEQVPLATQGSRWHTVPEFACIVVDGGHRHPVSFAGYISLYGSPRLGLHTSGAFCGSLPTADGELPVSLSDGNGDGRVAEFLDGEPYTSCGARFAFAREPGGEPDVWMPLARTMGFLGSVYRVELDMAGTEEAPSATLRLTPIAPPMGTVPLAGTGVTSLDLLSRNAALILRPDGDHVTAPTGMWHITEVRVHERGQAFAANSSDPTRARTLDVGPGANPPLAVGGPLTHNAGIGGLQMGGRFSVSMTDSTGVGGLGYRALAADDGSGPGWLIRRPGGRPIASGSFEYG